MKTFEIYQIINTITNEVVYVGSTERPLDERFYEHKTDNDYPEKRDYINSHNCRIEHLLYATEDSHLTREQTFYRKLKPMFGKKNAKQTHTDKVLKQKALEAIAKAQAKKGRPTLPPLDEYDRYIDPDKAKKEEKKFNNLGDLFK